MDFDLALIRAFVAATEELHIGADPTRVALIGTEWSLPSSDGISIVTVRPIPRFLWWVVYRADTQHRLVGRFLGLLEATRRRERWLDFDPSQDWLPDADRVDLLASRANTERPPTGQPL